MCILFLPFLKDNERAQGSLNIVACGKMSVNLNLIACWQHSFIPDISIAPFQVHYYSEALPTTALLLCRSQHTEALQATVSEGLAQGPYVAARLGFEPATFRMQATEPTTEPPCPTVIIIMFCG